MKQFLFLTIFLILLLPLFGQDSLILNQKFGIIKRDTIEADFLIEINSDTRFYSTNDFILQNNLILIDPKNSNSYNYKKLYTGDSVLIYYWDEKLKYLNKNFINITSITEFWFKTQYTGGKRRDRKNYKKSIITNKDSVMFLRFHATISVLNLGNKQLYIPWIYCNVDTLNRGIYKYCKNDFKNTLLFNDVLDFKYHSEYLKIRKKRIKY